MREIELKYLLYENREGFFTPEFEQAFGSRSNLEARVKSEGTHITQAYLSETYGRELAHLLGVEVPSDATDYRIRRSEKDKKVTYKFEIKGNGHVDREEVGAEMPADLFLKYIDRAEGKISKTRLKTDYRGNKIEIDMFDGLDLITAELEGKSEEVLRRIAPPGKEVSTDPNYKNAVMAKRQYQKGYEKP